MIRGSCFPSFRVRGLGMRYHWRVGGNMNPFMMCRNRNRTFRGMRSLFFLLRVFPFIDSWGLLPCLGGGFRGVKMSWLHYRFRINEGLCGAWIRHGENMKRSWLHYRFRIGEGFRGAWFRHGKNTSKGLSPSVEKWTDCCLTWSRMSLMSKVWGWIRRRMCWGSIYRSWMSLMTMRLWQVGGGNMLRNWTRTLRGKSSLFFLPFPFIATGWLLRACILSLHPFRGGGFHGDWLGRSMSRGIWM